MLKGERHHILNPFDGDRKRVAGEALADDDLDPTEVVTWMPMILLKEFSAKVGKF